MNDPFESYKLYNALKLHFETDRKHSYLKGIELKPWSEFEQAMRQPVDKNKKGSKIKK